MEALPIYLGNDLIRRWHDWWNKTPSHIAVVKDDGTTELLCNLWWKTEQEIICTHNGYLGEHIALLYPDDENVET